MNCLAVLGTAVVSYILGALWYSPLLFGKIWMAGMSFTEEKIEAMKKKGMAKTYFLSFVGSLAMSLVMACLIAHGGARTSLAGAAVGFWCWLGFIVPALLGSVLWEGKPPKLFLINIAYYLVTLGIMGAILATFTR